VRGLAEGYLFPFRFARVFDGNRLELGFIWFLD